MRGSSWSWGRYRDGNLLSRFTARRDSDSDPVYRLADLTECLVQHIRSDLCVLIARLHLPRVINDTRLHRVQVDVAEDGPPIRLRLDRSREEAATRERPIPPAASIEPTNEWILNEPHGIRKPPHEASHQQVEVGDHHAVSVDLQKAASVRWKSALCSKRVVQLAGYPARTSRLKYWISESGTTASEEQVRRIIKEGPRLGIAVSVQVLDFWILSVDRGHIKHQGEIGS